MHAGHVDDDAGLFRGQEAPHGLAGAQERAPQVDRENLFEVEAESSSESPAIWIPALLTRMSSRPYSLSTWPNI